MINNRVLKAEHVREEIEAEFWNGIMLLVFMIGFCSWQMYDIGSLWDIVVCVIQYFGLALVMKYYVTVPIYVPGGFEMVKVNNLMIVCLLFVMVAYNSYFVPIKAEYYQMENLDVTIRSTVSLDLNLGECENMCSARRESCVMFVHNPNDKYATCRLYVSTPEEYDLLPIKTRGSTLGVKQIRKDVTLESDGSLYYLSKVSSIDSLCSSCADICEAYFMPAVFDWDFTLPREFLKKSGSEEMIVKVERKPKLMDWRNGSQARNYTIKQSSPVYHLTADGGSYLAHETKAPLLCKANPINMPLNPIHNYFAITMVSNFMPMYNIHIDLFFSLWITITNVVRIFF